jgi:RimJ/RimL family protein N-acetyltransferase
VNVVQIDRPAVIIAPFHDVEKARALVIAEWGDDAIIIGCKANRTDEMSLIAATRADGALLGVGYYNTLPQVAQIGAIIVTGPEGAGVGSALFDAIVTQARQLNARKLRAVVTNDNFEAMRFYQRKGMRFVSLFPGIGEAFRAYRPGLRPMGRHGIPCRDIMELEMDL